VSVTTAARARLAPSPAPRPAPPRPAIRPEAASALASAYSLVIVSTGLLVAIGFVMVWSSRSVELLAKDINPMVQTALQAGIIAAGLVVALIASRWPLKWWIWTGPVIFVGALAAQVAALLVGDKVGGQSNWLPIGPFTFQPSELLKLGLAIWLGLALAANARRLDSLKTLALAGLAPIGLACGAVLAGQDVGTATVMGALSLGALAIAGLPRRKLLTVSALALGLGMAAMVSSPGRRARLEVLLNPAGADLLDEGYQIQQAKIALAQGGIFGAGLGTSREKWGYLTQANSDFIFAIIGEEFGLVGCLVVILLFALLAVGLFRIVALHPNRFAQVATGAIACWIIGQAVINIGMVVQLLPVVGVPLPFVSHGGTALFACLVAIGVVGGLLRGDEEVGPVLRASGGTLGRAAVVLGLRRPGKR
jgi:cell division protein FtsW